MSGRGCSLIVSFWAPPPFTSRLPTTVSSYMYSCGAGQASMEAHHWPLWCGRLAGWWSYRQAKAGQDHLWGRWETTPAQQLYSLVYPEGHAVGGSQVLLKRSSYGRVDARCTKFATSQGLVTYMLPVEVFATRIKIFDQQKVCLIIPFWSSWSLDF